MDYKEVREQIKPYLKDYVEGITSKSRYGGYVCPLCKSGEGKNHTGAFSIHEGVKWKCFSCGEGGDIFDLIGRVENIDGAAEQLKYAADKYNIQLDTYTPKQADTPAPKPAEEKPKQPAKDYTSFYRDCCRNRQKTDYLTKRGIPDYLQEKYWIGFCEDWRSPTALAAGKNPPPSGRIIIPTSATSYIARAIDDSNPYAKMKEGNVKPFNHKGILEAETPIYLVEGEIDALSILYAGAEAVGLGSINMAESFVKDYIEPIKEKITQPFIVAFDNDGKEQTKKAQEKLLEGLLGLELIAIEYNPCGEYKDANEALIKAPAAFECDVKEGMEKARKAVTAKEEEEREEYRSLYNSGSFLSGFLETIQHNPTPIQTTGFVSVDNVLDGGIEPGLIIVGAISSLGKTTFCLQLMDQMADLGRDCLIFSLEMGKDELISKSLSRETLKYTMREGKESKEALTTRTILRRGSELYKPQRDILAAAASAYRKYADHIYIVEGVGNVGVHEVKRIVEEHERLTGNTPIVMVDYLQMLTPYNDRASDKQNTDTAVLELKRLSRDHHTPVIAISSFNRESYTAPVNMASFKESGAIEYGSDVLIGLQYAGMDFNELLDNSEKERIKRVRTLLNDQLEKGKQGDAQTIEVKILKHRNGSRGTALLQYYPMFNYFDDPQIFKAAPQNNPFEK